MQNILKPTSLDSDSANPWVLLLVFLIFLIFGAFVFALLAPITVTQFYGLQLGELYKLIDNPESVDNGKSALMWFQALTSAGMFIITPLIFIQFVLKAKIISFFQLPEQPLRPVLMAVVILFCFMVANSVIIEWNQGLQMPESLSAFEQWAQAKESQLKELTEYLTTFSGIGEYLVALIVIALIPAVGEELVFRGLIQRLLGKAFKNHHLAIWLSAIVFGVFHLQFYGVIPRILLGALFGYLYYWSGFLSLAMVGHFINNGLTLTLLYFSQIKFIDYDPTSAESSPPLYVVSIFFAAGAVLLYLFRNLFLEPKDA